MVEVFEFLDANGNVIGCGTRVEFDHWTAEGTFDGYSIGKRIAWEKPQLDERRKAAWAA